MFVLAEERLSQWASYMGSELPSKCCVSDLQEELELLKALDAGIRLALASLPREQKLLGGPEAEGWGRLSI